MKRQEIVILDEKDIKILDILIKNSRMPVTKIAPKVKLSHDAVKYRINKLKKEGVIENFTTVINPAKLGFVIWGEILLSLWNLTPKRHQEFVKYLESDPKVVAIWNMSGKYEWWIEIYTKTLEEFNEIVNDMKIKFSDIIKDTETMFVLKEVKALQSLPVKYPL